MKIDTYLFDLDGTLIDSGRDIAEATNYTLKKLGYSPLPYEEIIKHVGYGGRKLLEGVLGNDNPDLIEKAVQIFREYYFNNPARYTKPYEDVPYILETLKKQNKKIAVITNKYEDISKEILKKVGLYDFIDLLIGGDTLSEKKPSPTPVLHAIDRLNTDKKSSIMVGDSETDIISGKKAGTKTCLVLYGFGKKELAKSYNPDFIVNNFSEILRLF